MDYFKDVYLKRINRYGDNVRSRIVGDKEHEFDNLFIQRSVYQALIYKVNENDVNIMISLQPHKWNETEEISNILISKREDQLHTGDILSIYQKVKNEERYHKYLILFIEDNLTLGYKNYKVILLDDNIHLTNEYGDTNMIVPVKIINNASIIKNSFSLKNGGYTGPNRELRCVSRDFDFFKKDQYFTHKNKGWKISGIDNISIENVSYISFGEVLKEEFEPRESEKIIVSDNENFFLNNK